MKTDIRITDKLPPFQASHMHNRTGEGYEVIGNPDMKVEGEWRDAILYRNQYNGVYVRTKWSFERSFTPC